MDKLSFADLALRGLYAAGAVVLFTVVSVGTRWLARTPAQSQRRRHDEGVQALGALDLETLTRSLETMTRQRGQDGAAQRPGTNRISAAD